MSPFITPDFLLDTSIARALYHEVAAGLPIIDYHSHLPPGDIAQRKGFRNLTDLWIGGDHYKWRLMRSAGVGEECITGSASDEAKFHAFCRVLPLAAGNPVHHWCHLELHRIFGIDQVINAANAEAIWTLANTELARMDCWSLLTQARVALACTTDDPADDLAAHECIAQSTLPTRVVPALRPDAAMRIRRAGFVDYVQSLSAASGMPITCYAEFVHALQARVDAFHARGGRVSDHAIDTPLCPEPVSAYTAQGLFERRLGGSLPGVAEQAAFQRRLMLDLGRAYARQGWAMCLHVGAQRDNSTRGLAALGADSGRDAISDAAHSAGLAGLLDDLDATDELPRTIVFGLNPAMNDMLGALIGSFQCGPARGKLQLGPAWWFNDHKDGNLLQLRTLARLGVLGTFVGMVTDSRSFASYPRHDYFRRLLCRLLGRWVADGEYPHDRQALDSLVRGICHDNARAWFLE